MTNFDHDDSNEMPDPEQGVEAVLRQLDAIRENLDKVRAWAVVMKKEGKKK